MIIFKFQAPVKINTVSFCARYSTNYCRNAANVSNNEQDILHPIGKTYQYKCSSHYPLNLTNKNLFDEIGKRLILCLALQ